MTARLLIEAVVRQMTVLIAELATAGGLRAPLADLADRVFLELSRELESHGVSRTVSADMFGMALRTYLRKVRNFDESLTFRGESLWQSVLDHVRARGGVSRAEVLTRFAADDQLVVRGVLQDLCDSGLLLREGSGNSVIYRAAPSKNGEASAASDSDALDRLLWAMIRHEGPFTSAVLKERLGVAPTAFEASLERLQEAGRVSVRVEESVPVFFADSIVQSPREPAGWEAGVYDHFQAVVKAILCSLRNKKHASHGDDRVGGSTYTFTVWQGHPLAATVYAQLGELRARASSLRQEVGRYNLEHGLPTRFDTVTLYVGQAVISEESVIDP